MGFRLRQTRTRTDGARSTGDDERTSRGRPSPSSAASASLSSTATSRSRLQGSIGRLIRRDCDRFWRRFCPRRVRQQVDDDAGQPSGNRNPPIHGATSTTKPAVISTAPDEVHKVLAAARHYVVDPVGHNEWHRVGSPLVRQRGPPKDGLLWTWVDSGGLSAPVSKNPGTTGAGRLRTAPRLVERRGRDSNPRRTKPPETVFETTQKCPICSIFSTRSPVGSPARARHRRWGWRLLMHAACTLRAPPAIEGRPLRLRRHGLQVAGQRGRHDCVLATESVASLLGAARCARNRAAKRGT